MIAGAINFHPANYSSRDISAVTLTHLQLSKHFTMIPNLLHQLRPIVRNLLASQLDGGRRTTSHFLVCSDNVSFCVFRLRACGLARLAFLVDFHIVLTHGLIFVDICLG